MKQTIFCFIIGKLYTLHPSFLSADAFPRVYEFFSYNFNLFQICGLPAVLCQCIELYVDVDLSSLFVLSGMRAVYDESFSFVQDDAVRL